MINAFPHLIGAKITRAVVSRDTGINGNFYRNIPEYSGIFRNKPEYSGIKYRNISWAISGISPPPCWGMVKNMGPS